MRHLDPNCGDGVCFCYRLTAEERLEKTLGLPAKSTLKARLLFRFRLLMYLEHIDVAAPWAWCVGCNVLTPDDVLCQACLDTWALSPGYFHEREVRQQAHQLAEKSWVPLDDQGAVDFYWDDWSWT